MSRVPDIKRIRAEDFKSDYKDLIDKVGYSFNSFADQVIDIMSKKLDFDNLNRDLVTIDVEISGSGTVVNNPGVKYNLKSDKVRGINIVKAVNINNPEVYPTAAPFVSFTFNNGILTILNVTGLQNSSKYRLTIEVIA